MIRPFYDYIIVGSGIAGPYAALLAREQLASRGGSVLVLTKGSVDDCNTRWAQGGIAASIGPDDSARRRLDDTIAAGGAGQLYRVTTNPEVATGNGIALAFSGFRPKTLWGGKIPSVSAQVKRPATRTRDGGHPAAGEQ